MYELKLGPIYYNRNSGAESRDMRKVCRGADLTLDLDSKSGFREIGVTWEAPTPTEDARLRAIEKDESMTLDEAAQGILDTVEDYLVTRWPTSGKIVVNISGGADSRIISYLIRKMYDEGTVDGDIVFITHEPEHTIAREVILGMGWREDQFCSFRDGATEDCYDWGLFEENINAFWPPGVIFYSEAVGDKSEATVISGNMGNLFSYPAYNPCFEGNRWDGYLGMAKNPPVMSLAATYAQWKDELSPFFAIAVIEHGCRVPNHLHVFNKETGRGIIRDRALEMLGDDNEIFRLAPYQKRYNLKFSAREEGRVDAAWKGSRLYKDFRQVRQYDPAVMMGTNCVATKLYGLATMYEGI